MMKAVLPTTETRDNPLIVLTGRLTALMAYVVPRVVNNGKNAMTRTSTKRAMLAITARLLCFLKDILLCDYSKRSGSVIYISGVGIVKKSVALTNRYAFHGRNSLEYVHIP